MRKIRKSEIALFTALALLLCYAALACAAVWYKGIPFAEFVYGALKGLLHPLRLRRTEMFPTFLSLAAVCWLLIFAAYIVSRGKFMFGKEMGSAEWGDCREINRHIRQEENVIVSQNIEMGMNISAPPKGHGRQLNTIVYGGTGTGKSRGYVTPGLLQANCSYVVVDPAGDLLKNTGNFFKKKGYRIKVLNLIDMDKSDCFNPWEYCKDQNAFQVMVDNFWRATEEPGAQKGDQFWDEAAKSLMLAFVFYLWETGDVINFHSISALASFAEAEEGAESLLDEYFNRLYEQNPDSLAVWFYTSFAKGAEKTKQSILQIFNAKLFRTKTQAFERMTAVDEMNLQELYDNPEQKSILYLIIPTMNKTYNFLVSMLYMQLFESINNYYPAHGACKQHLRIIMDEAANVALPKDFETIPAVCRKYNYSIVLILQSMSQLKTMFDRDRWEGVQANMDTQIYLGSTEQSTHEYFSKALGKATIDYKTRGYSRGMRGNSSENIQITGRELMTADEIRGMDNGECLVFIRDERPVRDKKYDVRRHPNYRYTAEGGGGEYEHRKETRQKRGSVVIGKERIQAMPLREEDLAALSGEWREAI